MNRFLHPEGINWGFLWNLWKTVNKKQNLGEDYKYTWGMKKSGNCQLKLDKFCISDTIVQIWLF